ncbi:hypothetical protein FWF93_02085 [Candidatus Saccharibacteria bacterium]|nr:hypothetical protein [Candidatus Saccharibacteria bacterium]
MNDDNQQPDTTEDKIPKRMDTKTIIMVAVAFVAFAGSVVATIFISPQNKNASTSQNDSTSATKQEAKAQEAEVGYDTTALKNHADKVEKLYDKFSNHVDSKYGQSATKIDFSNDPEAQTMLREFIVAVDGLDREIKDGPFDDLKVSWQEFKDAFDKRRDYIIDGVSDKEDGDWAQKLVIVYLIITSKVGR